MKKNSLSNASSKRLSNHNPCQSSASFADKRSLGIGINDKRSLVIDRSSRDVRRACAAVSSAGADVDVDWRDIYYRVLCICGRALIRVTLSESYSDEPSVCCNMCFMIYRNPSDVIYICELRKTTSFHNNGYGFCGGCAAQLCREESVLSSYSDSVDFNGSELIKRRLNGTISMLESDGTIDKHDFLPFMDRMSWFERVGLEYLAKQHMTDDEMCCMKHKLQSIKDVVIEATFDSLKSKIVEIDTMVTRLREIQMRGNTSLLLQYNNAIRIHRRQLLRIQNESSGKYRNQSELLNKLSLVRSCISFQISSSHASCVCGEELFAMSVEECNYSDSWWCSHCCETYYKHDILYHCENGKKCIYNELMQYIYDLCHNCWCKLKNEEICATSLTLNIRSRLWQSLAILENAILSDKGASKEYDKLAKRICNFETQFVKLKSCLSDEERDACCTKMQELINILRKHLSLCLCGDIMIKLRATNYYCAHCFETFKGKERVITFCRMRDKCKFYQNGYRLCQECSNDLMCEELEDIDINIDIHIDMDHSGNLNNNNLKSKAPSNIISGTDSNSNSKQVNTEINWSISRRIQKRFCESIRILSRSNDSISMSRDGDKTQWNEHWNDWISRCNQFSSCLNKSKVHLHCSQFAQIADNFEGVKSNAVQRTLVATNESIVEIESALNASNCTIANYRKLNANVTEFRRQLLKMKRHSRHCNCIDICAQLQRLALIRDAANSITGDRITTCICGEELFRRKASECYGNNYWCNRCFKTYSKDTYLYHCEVHKECEYHQFGYDLCQECAQILSYETLQCSTLQRIVHRLRASLSILECDVATNHDNQHKDDMAKRVDNFEMQYDPLIKYIENKCKQYIARKLDTICNLIKPYLPLCLCGSWFKHGSCDNAFICRCCSKSYEKGVETYYCKNTENCLYWKHGYNLCETCARMYKEKQHKKERLTDRITHRLWNSIDHIQIAYKTLCTSNPNPNEWHSLVLRYDNCQQYIQKCTYTHWLYNILSTHACLDNTQTHLMKHTLNTLGNAFKAHVPLCFCGDVFIYVQSPYELDCKHCFKELKENDKTYFCKSRDDCKHWNNSYYLCQDCVNELTRNKHKDAGADDDVQQRIKSRLTRSLQILRESIADMDDDDGAKWLKMAYKMDQYSQHCSKLKLCLNASWCTAFDDAFCELMNCVKMRVPLCLCGAFFVHELSPIDFRCRHCFELYDSEKVVIHYCQQQRECLHFNSDYYLCNECAMSLRISVLNETISDRSYLRLRNSIVIINNALESAMNDDEWKDVSVRVYFYEQQLERLNAHLSISERDTIASSLQSTLCKMKKHLATCLCGNLFVSGPSPIDYECRSCFHECRVEHNIYVCKSKQKCEHWRNHYYICDDCSVLLRKCTKFDCEQLRIVDRLHRAMQFIADEFNESMRNRFSRDDDAAAADDDDDGNRTSKLDIFSKYLHRINSFEQNFLSQIESHLTPVQYQDTAAHYREFKSYILRVSCNFIDEKYRNKFESELIIFGFIRELYLSLDMNTLDSLVFAAVPEYVFHVCLDYYFQIHPQIIVISMAKGIFRSLPLKFDNIELMDLNAGISSCLSFYDMKSFNKSSFHHVAKSKSKRKRKKSLPQITSDVCSKTIMKHKSWNKKECAFCVAINIGIPSFITSIKPSLFDDNHHYDVIFKCGGEKHSNQLNKQYSNEACALIIDSATFNHHYSDHYAFKSRHFRLESHLKKSRSRHNYNYKRHENGYSLSLPSLPQKKRCCVTFDYQRLQLLAYCDNKFDVYSLPFNDSLKSENEWKWHPFKNQMKWTRTRPSLSMMTSLTSSYDDLLFIIGDTQNNHAQYAEIYSFTHEKWMEIAQVPYISHNGCLFNDSIENRMYYIGGPQRNAGYYDVCKDQWCKLPCTQYIYNQSNSVIWNSLESKQTSVIWCANTTNCELFDARDNAQKWQIFPNLDNNNTHLKLQNFLNIRFDSTNCDYTLLCRI